MYYYVACVAAGYSPASLNRAFRKESMVFRGTGQCVCLGDSRRVVTWSCITYYAAQRTALDRDNDRTNPMSIHLLPVTHDCCEKRADHTPVEAHGSNLFVQTTHISSAVIVLATIKLALRCTTHSGMLLVLNDHINPMSMRLSVPFSHDCCKKLKGHSATVASHSPVGTQQQPFKSNCTYFTCQSRQARFRIFQGFYPGSGQTKLAGRVG